MPDNKKQRRKPVKQQNAALAALEKEAALVDREAAEELSRSPRKFGVLRIEPEEELGQRLQEARKNAGLTQEELAERTKRADADGNGLSGAVISLYERGVNRPGPREIRILCETLRVTPNYLVYGDEYPFDQDSINEYNRYWGWVKSEEEFYAAVNYCFFQLHKNHKSAMMELMVGLLRGWNKQFDKDIETKAVEVFLQQSDHLKVALSKQRKNKT